MDQKPKEYGHLPGPFCVDHVDGHYPCAISEVPDAGKLYDSAQRTLALQSEFHEAMRKVRLLVSQVTEEDQAVYFSRNLEQQVKLLQAKFAPPTKKPLHESRQQA